MRFYIISALILAAPILSARAENTAPARKIQKVAIVNLAWDTARAAEVEADIKTELVKKGVSADSLRTLTMGDKKPASVKELAALIQSGGYDSLLCIGARKTMQVMDADRASDFPTMESCLSIFLTGKYPSGQSLRSEPFVVDSHPTQQAPTGGEPITPRTPIASNSGAAPVTYYKRTLRLFDVAQQTLFWEKKIMVKMPRDLQGSLQTLWIAHQTSKALEQSGLLP